MQVNDDFILLRKRKANSGSFSTNEKIAIRFNNNGRFHIFKPLNNVLNIKNGDALMFGFANKQTTLFVLKEEPLDDNFICKDAKGSRKYFRFSSKALSKDIVCNIYNGVDKKDYYLQIDGEIDSNGRLILKHFTN